MLKNKNKRGYFSRKNRTLLLYDEKESVYDIEYLSASFNNGYFIRKEAKRDLKIMSGPTTRRARLSPRKDFAILEDEDEDGGGNSRYRISS